MENSVQTTIKQNNNKQSHIAINYVGLLHIYTSMLMVR